MKNSQFINHRSVTTNNGQSLYEVIIAVGIVALILVTAVSLSTTSIRNSSFARNDSLATKYAQEGTEFLRQQRDTSWGSFYGVADGSELNLGSLNWPPSGSCSVPSATHFCRTIKLNRSGGDTVNAIISVSWTDGQGTHSVRSATKFTRWR